MRRVDGVAYAVFLATGVAAVLPGAMLPLLLARWRLNDAEGGLLFFIFFLASTVGAVASRGELAKSVARGCGAVALGVGCLAFASGQGVFAAFAVFGLGLGMAMTSVSLLQARRHDTRRTAEMARLNLVWAAGASAGPSVVLAGAARFGVAGVLVAVALFFVAAGVAAGTAGGKVNAVASSAEERDKTTWLLLAMVPLATGVEAAAGGWIATYSKRAGQTLGEVAGVATCFWLGMLISRLLQSNRRFASASTTVVLAGAPWAMVTGLAMVVLARSAWPMLAGSLLLGLAAGPVYPLLISLAMRGGDGDNSIFVLGGCGAAVLPLLTGVVSRQSHSLKAGIGVPLAGAAVMACLGAGVWRGMRVEHTGD